MADILQFRPPSPSARKPGRIRNAGAIIFFPGVRYERDAVSGRRDSAKDGRRGPENHPAQRNS